MTRQKPKIVYYKVIEGKDMQLVFAIVDYKTLVAVGFGWKIGDDIKMIPGNYTTFSKEEVKVMAKKISEYYKQNE